MKREFAGLRTGRAHPALLEPVRVIAYGSEVPLNQVGTVGTPEPRMLTVQVWDKSLVSAVERAIRDGGLGLNPAADGMLIRVPIPQLTTERRNELARILDLINRHYQEIGNIDQEIQNTSREQSSGGSGSESLDRILDFVENVVDVVETGVRVEDLDSLISCLLIEAID